MFFRIDYFHTSPVAPIAHLRRSSRGLASNVFAGPTEVPILALRARSCVLAARDVQPRTSGRILSFAKLASALRQVRGISEGPRAA